MAQSQTTKREAVDLLNSLANAPENLKALGYDCVDLSAFFDRPGNLMIGDERGVALFAPVSDQVVEGHYLFAPTTRGASAVALAKDIISHLFTLHDVSTIVGHVPVDNKASRTLTRALGFTRQGTSVNSDGRSCVTYLMERLQWAELSAES